MHCISHLWNYSVATSREYLLTSIALFNNSVSSQHHFFQFSLSPQQFHVNIMTEVDYGYGPEADYGYSTEQPEYGYGGQQQDYGYGEQTDYGYGEQTDNGEQKDYGYGEQTDYGYGEQTDYGYGDAKPDDDEPKQAEPAAPRKQVKRRCSVTKFSLDAGVQEAQQAQQDMKNMVDLLRQQPAAVEAPAPVYVEYTEPESVMQETSDDKSAAAQTSGTMSCESSYDGSEPEAVMHTHERKVKKGMMSRMRKRLSVFH